MVQLSDVAKRAGVSTASVSRVLNHPDKVSLETRERVLAAMQALGYVRDGVARALASRRSYTIGKVVPTLGIGIFASGVENLQRRLQEFGYQLLIASTQYDASKEVEAVRALIERGVDGIALVGHQHDPQIYRLLNARGIPYVNTYQFEENNEHPCIGFDNAKGAFAIVKHLIDLGHREFALITSPVRFNDRIASRLSGMIACLKAHSVDIAPPRIIEVPHKIADGRSAAQVLLREHPQVTAICCTADVLAIGALYECQQLGLRIPEDLSLTGFDDLEIVRHLNPPLTTVHVPVESIGERVADYLLGRIQGRSLLNKTLIEANLVLRGSTARPRAGRGRLRLAVNNADTTATEPRDQVAT